MSEADENSEEMKGVLVSSTNLSLSPKGVFLCRTVLYEVRLPEKAPLFVRVSLYFGMFPGKISKVRLSDPPSLSVRLSIRPSVRM
jgi:hypothetical protein